MKWIQINLKFYIEINTEMKISNKESAKMPKSGAPLLFFIKEYKFWHYPILSAHSTSASDCKNNFIRTSSQASLRNDKIKQMFFKIENWKNHLWSEIIWSIREVLQNPPGFI